MEEHKQLWTPGKAFAENSNLNAYMNWLRKEKDLSFKDYQALWEWSVTNIDDFWKSISAFFKIEFEGTYESVLTGTMPEVKWFEGTRLNYAKHILRSEEDSTPAIIFKSEASPVVEISWKALKREVASVQSVLMKHDVRAGDRIAGYLPCIPEATAAMLATTALGAVWSSCSPDFGTNAVIDRFMQIEPSVLIAIDEYTYGGKTFDKKEVITALVQALPSLKAVIIITQKETGNHPFNLPTYSWKQIEQSDESKINFVNVPFSHPLWILFSSGTTGLPKAITHSHGGILLEQFKYGVFHNDFKKGERCFWYTTTGWMMWNYIHSCLLCGGTMVLYDGSPGYPDLSVLWKFCEEAKINHFGTSAAFILANLKAKIRPAEFDLSSLRSIGSTGSTLPPEGFDWVYQNVKKDLWLASMSGGTDVCSAFVGGNPTWPVYSGEIQCRALGCKLEAFNEEGESVKGEVGEMVITAPMPSMPMYFWNDPDFKRYRESYFEMYEGIWRHGDWIEITPREGVIIYGRSDATLNRGGIRIGTSEIYRAVDKVPEVKDSLIICIEKEGGEFWMPLFVVMKEGSVLSDDIKKKINAIIRSEYTPRHVPDEIIAAPDIPFTISGKKTETPVKKVLMGKDPQKVVNAGSLRNAESMEFFTNLAKQIQSTSAISPPTAHRHK